MKNGRPQGCIALTLHAHLPYVVHHGTWPHGMEWLLEAAAETYLPLLRVLGNLERDGLALRANLNLSPILLEQLRHPAFQAEFPRYAQRKILAAQEDEAYFHQSGEKHFACLARSWRDFYSEALAHFESLSGDLVAGFRQFEESGQIEIVTCCATHSYLPLLGTDASVRAQIQTGVAAHRHHFGRSPRGIWVPECGYRPAGPWQPPVIVPGHENSRPAVPRIGVEQALAEAGLEFFFVDAQLVERSRRVLPGDTDLAAPRPSAYRAWIVDGPCSAAHPVTAFPRDPRTGLQVWSGERGYPVDPHALDFHKKRWPGGHRYWQVTESQADLAMKTPYYPQRAAERTLAQAEHFVQVAMETLRDQLNPARPPILTAAFDAELFGHWWFEGPSWLEQVARLVAEEECPLLLTTAGAYRERVPPEGSVALGEGSWGKNGGNEVWLNEQTAWTWAEIYAAEDRVEAIASDPRWRDRPLGRRIAQQLCRELLLLESSDWPFLITTGAARDYAEQRFLTHRERFRELEQAWEEWAAAGSLQPETGERLRQMEERDSIFADIDPALWAK
jgi:1,4-alpha-glucan branching enzyme